MKPLNKDEHLTNEFLYITNDPLEPTQEGQNVQEKEDAFENKARDTRIRLDLHKF
jgi:hypothetical protein